MDTQSVNSAEAGKTWFGHPRGVSTLFFTEMWERFSYYGMRAFLILYMTAPATAGGLGFDDSRAGRIYGLYTGSVWLATIGGGLVADWLLGAYRSVFLGAVLITLGHLTLTIQALPFFFTGLGLIVLGTGLLKPNVTTMVGSLYSANDPRRDAGFSIFYMGINLGACLGPIIAGYLAQRVNWHIGFGCAAVGMTFGMIQYFYGRKYLKPAMDRLDQQAAIEKKEQASTPGGFKFTSVEWKRLFAIVVFFLFASIFWGAYEQAGSTLNLFADRHTRLSVLGISFPSSWFQSVPAFFVITMAPLFAWLWVRLGPKEPSSPAKFTLGLLFVGLAFLLLVPGASSAQTGIRVSPMWLVGVYFLEVIGELCLSPVGLSLVTKLSPRKVVGMMMGVWFLSIAVGSIIAGSLAGFMEGYSLTKLFGGVALVAILASVVLLILIRPIRKLMGGVH
jgi:proton-dependent oligopeptide transporter, POT family